MHSANRALWNVIEADVQRAVVRATAVLTDHPSAASCPGNCVLLAGATVDALRARGRHAVIQAGSCFWRRVPHDVDAGDQTDFGYQWSPDCIVIADLAGRGPTEVLPEMHAWVGLPETQEIVDPAAGLIPDNCQRLLGWNWPGPRPPAVLWCTADQLPDHARYAPDLTACLFAAILWGHLRLGLAPDIRRARLLAQRKVADGLAKHRPAEVAT